jgi:hypothetical protein
MTMFHLFRLRVERPLQATIFHEPELPNMEIVRRSIEEQPTAQTRKGALWALGNLRRILDDVAYSGALGKVRQRKAEKYDEDHKTFSQELFEEAPFTLVIFDVNLQICAIATKSDLGNPAQLARTLATLLTSSATAQNRGVRIIASQIKDPREFLTHLRRAERITRFEVTFKRPNPIDVEQDFLKPMEKILAETGGENGKTTLSGDGLSSGPLEELSNSAAATGDNASAKLKLPEHDKFVTKSLNNNPATISTNESQTRDGLEQIAMRMRELYNIIRRAGGT